MLSFEHHLRGPFKVQVFSLQHRSCLFQTCPSFFRAKFEVLIVGPDSRTDDAEVVEGMADDSEISDSPSPTELQRLHTFCRHPIAVRCFFSF